LLTGGLYPARRQLSRVGLKANFMRQQGWLNALRCRACPLWVISGHFAVQPRQRGAVANMVEETTSQ
jgi:hypothetical protein